MKLLLDENLSPRLVSRLAELYGEIMRRNAVRIVEFEKDPTAGVLPLRVSRSGDPG